MKLNFALLSHLSNLSNLFATLLFNYKNAVVSSQSLPHNYFTNGNSNNTFTFSKAIEDNAFCEYDVCREVLSYEGSPQWIAYLDENASSIITYRVCLGGGRDSIHYVLGSPECVDFSGVDINVTSTLSGITAISSDDSVSVWVNGTSSPFQIMIDFASTQSLSPTQMPTGMPSYLYPEKITSSEPAIIPVYALAMIVIGAAISLFIGLCIKYGFFSDNTPAPIASKSSARFGCHLFARLGQSAKSNDLEEGLVLETYSTSTKAK